MKTRSSNYSSKTITGRKKRSDTTHESTQSSTKRIRKASPGGKIAKGKKRSGQQAIQQGSGRKAASRVRSSLQDRGLRKSGEKRLHSPEKEKLRSKMKPRQKTAAVREIGHEMRLNKFLADAGVTSRRKADELILSGVVRVNGRVTTELGVKINPSTDEIRVNDKPVYLKAQLVYILINKPKDCITSTDDEKGRTTVMDLIPSHHRVYPVGRLDRNTTGALLLTNDGDLAYKLTHPKFQVPKLYRATIDRKIRPQDLEHIRQGVNLEDGLTAPCDAEVLDPPHNTIIGIVLHEGKNRQVRRMFEALGYKVKKLERVQYAGLTVSRLKRGGWRYLEESEVQYLKKVVRDSKSKRDLHVDGAL